MTPAAFAEDDHGRFTEWLRRRSEPAWTRAVEHRFVRELGDDTIDDAVFRRYLVQDYAFVDTLTRLVAYAAGHAPSLSARAELAAFLGALTDDEDAYFERAFDALSVPTEERDAPVVSPTTAAFEDLLVRGALEGGYATSLAVLLPVEWIYHEWADAIEGRPQRFYLAEWIDLHRGPEFGGLIEWLRGELDDAGPDLPPVAQRRVDRHFRRAVTLEASFFDDVYA